MTRLVNDALFTTRDKLYLTQDDVVPTGTAVNLFGSWDPSLTLDAEKIFPRTCP